MAPMNAESTTTTIAAIDVGGANLKVAHGDGTTRCRAFAVWREPHRLADAIESILSAGPAFDRLAVTMTAELCDCFATKREGVTRVLDAVDRASARISPGSASASRARSATATCKAIAETSS